MGRPPPQSRYVGPLLLRKQRCLACLPPLAGRHSSKPEGGGPATCQDKCHGPRTAGWKRRTSASPDMPPVPRALPLSPWPFLPGTRPPTPAHSALAKGKSEGESLPAAKRQQTNHHPRLPRSFKSPAFTFTVYPLVQGYPMCWAHRGAKKTTQK